MPEMNPVYFVQSPEEKKNPLQTLLQVAVIGGIGYWVWTEFLKPKDDLGGTVYETVNNSENR